MFNLLLATIHLVVSILARKRKGGNNVLFPDLAMDVTFHVVLVFFLNKNSRIF